MAHVFARRPRPLAAAALFMMVVGAHAIASCSSNTTVSLPTCSTVTTACNGICTDTAVDSKNCGACGVTCGAGTSCSGAVCVPSGLSCSSGQKACFNQCVSVDDASFGCTTDACSPCAPANATGVCMAGACTIGACTAPYANCNSGASDGCNVDTSSDANNCSACGMACKAGDICKASKCVVAPASSSASTGTASSSSTAATSSSSSSSSSSGAGGATTSSSSASSSGAGGAPSSSSSSSASSGVSSTATTSSSSGSAASKRVFLTSTTFSGNLTEGSSAGILGGDAKCQKLADSASLGGTWKAWLSDATTQATDRLAHSTVPYVRLDGVIVASSWTDLVTNGLQHPITVTDMMGTLASSGTTMCSNTAVDPAVWTFTLADGTRADAVLTPCTNWTASLLGAAVGGNPATTASWTTGCSSTITGCDGLAALYCFEQ